MITLFTVPKPMHGEFRHLQENAVGSWRAMGPDVEILILGEEDGVAGLAARFGARHLPNVARNEYGTPRIDDIFRIGQQEGTQPLLCYVNADIILGSDFPAAVRAAAGFGRPFLMVGQRWTLKIDAALDFTDPGWWEKLRERVRAEGGQDEKSAIDYFVFRRGLWPAIPPFAVGRTMWDNWLIYAARARGAAVIDAGAMVQAVHPFHGYRHHPGGRAGVWEGPEAERNLELAGGLEHYFTIADATHLLAPQGVRSALDGEHLRRRWQMLPALSRPVGWLVKGRDRIAKAILALRIRIARARGRIPPADRS
jgi:hypothetical protein